MDRAISTSEVLVCDLLAGDLVLVRDRGSQEENELAALRLLELAAKIETTDSTCSPVTVT